MAGGGSRDGGTGEPIVEDKTPRKLRDPQKPEPKTPGDDVAPKGQDHTSIVLQEVQDLLRSGKSTKELEAETGMSRQEMDQFVKKFEKVKKTDATPGSDLKGDVAKDKILDKNRKIADPIKANTVRGRVERGPGTIAQDNLAGDAEGSRSVAPAEYKARWDAYRSSLSKSDAPASTNPKSPPAGR